MVYYELFYESIDEAESLHFSDDLEALDEFNNVIKGEYEDSENKPLQPIYASLTEYEQHGGIGTGERLIAEYKVYTTYAADTDITFILVDTRTDDDLKTEVKGFYYGKEERELTEKYIGHLVAEYPGLYKG